MQMGRARWPVFCVCEARVFSRGALDLCVRFHGSTGHCRNPMQRKRRIKNTPSGLKTLADTAGSTTTRLIKWHGRYLRCA